MKAQPAAGPGDCISCPLCVDLEGALLCGDIVWEVWFALLRQRPGKAMYALVLALSRTGRLRQYLAANAQIEASVLPYNESLLSELRRTKAAGRRLVLITALPRPWAQSISSYLALFEDVLAGDTGATHPEESKGRILQARFGERGFDYVGGAKSALWSLARSGWLVSGVATSAVRLGESARAEELVLRKAAARGVWARQLRLHQWLKNLLVCVPLIASRRFMDREIVAATVAAFFAFGFVASGNYILNDLLDLQHDRQHPRKRYRPLAAGILTVHSSVLVMAALFSAGAAIAVFLPATFGEVLLLYLAGTLAYSLRLKRSAPLDTFTLAGLYTLRVFAGNAATKLPPSFWLLAFSVFLFLSLAMAKRHAELLLAGAKGNDAPRGRGYLAADREMVSQLGVGAGYISVLVLALYLNSPQAALLYGRPDVLWLLCLLLLYWITRLWLIAHRGQLDDDPLIFAIRDRLSRYTAIMAVVVLWFAR